MQPRSRACTDALLRRLVGIFAPALGIIDDADCRITICRDEHEPANRLRSGRVVAREEPAVRMGEPEMNEDRRALRKHAAIGEHERRYLTERIHFEELGIS